MQPHVPGPHRPACLAPSPSAVREMLFQVLSALDRAQRKLGEHAGKPNPDLKSVTRSAWPCCFPAPPRSFTSIRNIFVISPARQACRAHLLAKGGCPPEAPHPQTNPKPHPLHRRTQPQASTTPTWACET